MRSSISNRISELESSFNNQFNSQSDKNLNFDNQVEEIKSFMIVLKDTLAKKYRTFKAEQVEEMTKFQQIINQSISFNNNYLSFSAFNDFQILIKSSLDKQFNDLNLKINALSEEASSKKI